MSSIENKAAEKEGLHLFRGLIGVICCVVMIILPLHSFAGGKRGLSEDESPNIDEGMIVKYSKTYAENETSEGKEEIDPPPFVTSTPETAQVSQTVTAVPPHQSSAVSEQPQENFFSVLKTFRSWAPKAEHYLDILLRLHDALQSDGAGLNAIELVRLGYLLGHTPQGPLLAQHQILLHGAIETWSHGRVITEETATTEFHGNLVPLYDAITTPQNHESSEESPTQEEHEPTLVEVSSPTHMPAKQSNHLSDVEETLSLLELQGKKSSLEQETTLLEQEQRENREFREQLQEHTRYLASALEAPHKIDLNVLPEYLQSLTDALDYIEPTDPLYERIKTYESVARNLLSDSTQARTGEQIAALWNDNRNG